jgi:hypothetical protein
MSEGPVSRRPLEKDGPSAGATVLRNLGKEKLSQNDTNSARLCHRGMHFLRKMAVLRAKYLTEFGCHFNTTLRRVVLLRKILDAGIPTTGVGWLDKNVRRA